MHGKMHGNPAYLTLCNYVERALLLIYVHVTYIYSYTYVCSLKIDTPQLYEL